MQPTEDYVPGCDDNVTATLHGTGYWTTDDAIISGIAVSTPAWRNQTKGKSRD